MISAEFQPLKHESSIRLGVFLGMLLLMSLWELYAPHRQLSMPRWRRWLNNGGLLILGTVLLRAVFPLAAVGVAAMAAEQQWGLFYAIPIAHWQVVVLSIIGLDFITYWQHLLFHFLPPLWHLHKVHHADLNFDVTTGLRFHPLEILLSMVGKVAIVLLLGTPVIAVLLFEVILNATSMFNHGNIRLSPKLEHCLRWVIVTPDMHRIHHSVIPKETNSNFGFNLPWWDRIFGTYRHRSSPSDNEITIGLMEYQKDLRVGQLHWMLILPFLKHSSQEK